MSREENPKTCSLCSAPLAVFSITVNGVEQSAIERCTNQSCEAHRRPEAHDEGKRYIAEIHEHQREMEKLKAEGKPIPTFAEWKAAKPQPSEQPVRKSSKRGD